MRTARAGWHGAPCIESCGEQRIASQLGQRGGLLRNGSHAFRGDVTRRRIAPLVGDGDPPLMTLRRLRPFVALGLVLIAGFAFLGYAQYRATASARKQAALSTELFTMRDAIDAFNAG